MFQQEWKSAAYDQVKSDLYEEIKILYVQAKSYEKRFNKLAELVEEDLVSQNAKELLEAGEITYSEYLFDIEIMYEMKDDYLKSQRNYYNTLAAIKKLLN